MEEILKNIEDTKKLLSTITELQNDAYCRGVISSLLVLSSLITNEKLVIPETQGDEVAKIQDLCNELQLLIKDYFERGERSLPVC